MGSSSRWWLNQATHSRVASSTASLVFHGARRIQQLTAATSDGQVVLGVTKLASEQKQLLAAIGVPTPKAQEFV